MKSLIFVTTLLVSGLSYADKIDLSGIVNSCQHLTGLKGDQLGGKPAVLTLSATWCGPCLELMPKNEALATQYAGKVNFVYVMTAKSVLSDAQGDAAMYADMAYYFDGDDKLPSQLGFDEVPYSIVLDKDGNEVFTGIAEDNFDTYTKAIDDLSKSVR